jgi:hypothetical protein
MSAATAKAQILVLISEDPRLSHRASEALRIALGLAASENAVTIVLAGPAAHLLDEDTDALVDGEDVARHRASLTRLGIPFRVEGSGLPAGPARDAGPRVIPATVSDVANLVSLASRFIVF